MSLFFIFLLFCINHSVIYADESLDEKLEKNRQKEKVLELLLPIINQPEVSEEKDPENKDKEQLSDKTNTEDSKDKETSEKDAPSSTKKSLSKEEEIQQEKRLLREGLNKFDKEIMISFLKDYSINFEGIEQWSKDELVDKIMTYVYPIIRNSKKLNLSNIQNYIKLVTGRSSINIDGLIKGLQGLTNESILRFQAEEIFASQVEDEKGYRRILLFGNVVLKLFDAVLEADQVIIKLNNKNQPTESLAVGDLLLVAPDKSRIVGKKIIFYPLLNRAEIFDAQGFWRPFYLTGKVANQVENLHYNFHHGWMTSCYLLHPHYRLSYTKGWLYPDEMVWAQNVIYTIGHTPIGYTPFFYRSELKTRLRSSSGYERGLGLFINNTLIVIPGLDEKETMEATKSIYSSDESSPSSDKGLDSISMKKNLGFKFMLDYYERIGIYAGAQMLLSDSNYEFNLEGATAFDRSVRYVGGNELFSNLVVTKDGLRELNRLRWRVLVEGAYKLINSSLFDMNLKGKYSRHSDPFFSSQFEGYRRYIFDLYKWTGFDDGNSSFASNSDSGGQNIIVSSKIKLWKFYLNLEVDLKYQMQIQGDELQDYSLYKNFRDILTLPKLELSYSDSYSLLGKNQFVLKSDKKKKEKEEKDQQESILKEFGILESDDSEDDSKDDEKDIDIKDETYVEDDLKTSNDLELKISFSYSVNFDLNNQWYYKLVDGSPDDKKIDASNQWAELDDRILKTDLSLNTSLPFNLSYSFFSWRIGPNFKFKNRWKRTKDADESQKKLDEQSNYPSYSTGIDSSLEFKFFQDYKYLGLTFGVKTAYALESRFDSVYKEDGRFFNEKNRSQSVSWSTWIDFAKQRLAVSSSDDLYISVNKKEQIDANKITLKELLKEQRNNLSISFNSKPFDFLTFTNQFVYSRADDKKISNSLTTKLNLVENYALFDFFYLNSLSYTLTWVHDFQRYRASKLDSSINIDFSLTENWQFIISANSSNRDLYLYSEEKALLYGEENKNIFIDLLKSFWFVDNGARRESSFKLDSFNFILRHDLHDWMFEFKLDLSLKKREKIYYFEPTINFVLYLKDMHSFRYPKLEKKFTRD